jgi:hypothetical protein
MPRATRHHQCQLCSTLKEVVLQREREPCGWLRLLCGASATGVQGGEGGMGSSSDTYFVLCTLGLRDPLR